MTDDARLTPFTIAVYTAFYDDAELAAVAAAELARQWRTPIAVVRSRGFYGLFDLADDPTGYVEHAALTVIEPPNVDVVDVTVTNGRL